MSFFETSAKTNQNVNEIFNFLTQEILKANEGKSPTDTQKLKKGGNNKEGKKGCCK